jgi:hypothetical protein
MGFHGQWFVCSSKRGMIPTARVGVCCTVSLVMVPAPYYLQSGLACGPLKHVLIHKYGTKCHTSSRLSHTMSIIKVIVCIAGVLNVASAGTVTVS